MPLSSSPSVIPLLLTSSIVAHDVAVRLKDTQARLHHALESVEQWLRVSPLQPLVLCDGSSYDLTDEVRHRFPHAVIECLAFENDQIKVREFGRGHGEGEIVKYAIEHSRLIHEAGCFVKCTSKLWVENFDECMRYWNGNLLLSGVFLNTFSPRHPTLLRQVDTRFYAMSVDTYKRYFQDAHITMDSRAGHGLEDSFHDVLARERMQGCLLPVPPIINGVGGGTGTYYRNRGLRILKERLRLWLARHQRKFCPLFAP